MRTSLPCSHSAVFPVDLNLACRLIRTPEHLQTVELCLKRSCRIIICLINQSLIGDGLLFRFKVKNYFVSQCNLRDVVP